MRQDRFIMTFSDILLICRRSKRLILFSGGICALLALMYTLTRPVEYRAVASFREKAKSAESTKSSSLAMIIGLPELNENAAISLMKSRKLIERAILAHDLQAKIAPAGFKFEPLPNIPKNLVAEYAHLSDAEKPLLPEASEGIRARHVHFSQETPLKLFVRFVDEENYVILTSDKRDLGSGRLGMPFEGSSFTFTLTRADATPLKGLSFKLILKPLSMVADDLSKKIDADPDNMDKGLLNLSFAHKNRFMASHFLNSLMAVYQDFLKEEHQRITGEQVAYLNKRQDETSTKLQMMMYDHAQALSENMATIEFLFHNQQSFSQKTLMIDFELKRLDKALKEGVTNYDKLGIETGDPTAINQILSEMRRHKQHMDSIDIALRNMEQEDQEIRKRSFSGQMKALETLRQQDVEAKAVLAALENRQPIPTASSLYKDPKYMLREWNDKVGEIEKEVKSASVEDREGKLECLKTCKSNFRAYLGNMIRLLGLEGRLLKERLSHSQSPQAEFQGINLNTASQLYVNYSKSLNEIEAEIVHYQFILDQMQDPAFEPSSLSTVLEDPVSREIINRAGTIGLTLKDENNHSPRELERLKLDLAQQKEFLHLHAGQTLQLLQLRQKLYREKLVALQRATRELLQQEIALLEKSLSDYLSNRIHNLQQEQNAIEQQQLVLRQTMQKMPAKWAAEKLIDQYLETNRKMMEEIAKLVESKNIALNLDLSQSAPVDMAQPPLNPQTRKSLLFLVIGGLFGAFASIGFVLTRAVAKGLPATRESLSLLEQHVAGTLNGQDLDPLRRSQAYLGGKAQLLLLGRGPDYSPLLAELIAKSGKRVILLPLSFDQAENNQEGLLQYLEGEIKLPKVIQGVEYDTIASGGSSPFSSELLASQKFSDLKEILLQHYDCLLAVSHAEPASGEAEALFGLFDQTLISIKHETLSELKPYLQAGRVSFIFVE